MITNELKQYVIGALKLYKEQNGDLAVYSDEITHTQYTASYMIEQLESDKPNLIAQMFLKELETIREVD